MFIRNQNTSFAFTGGYGLEMAIKLMVPCWCSIHRWEQKLRDFTRKSRPEFNETSREAPRDTNNIAHLARGHRSVLIRDFEFTVIFHIYCRTLIELSFYYHILIFFNLSYLYDRMQNLMPLNWSRFIELIEYIGKQWLMRNQAMASLNSIREKNTFKQNKCSLSTLRMICKRAYKQCKQHSIQEIIIASEFDAPVKRTVSHHTIETVCPPEPHRIEVIRLMLF